MNHTTLKLVELPEEERPRERLIRHGATTLSDAELLAVLLRTGRPGLGVLAFARELLHEFSGLSGMVGLGFSDLRRPGLASAKGAVLLAALELGRRLAASKIPRRQILSRPSAVANYLALRYARREQEVVGALFLDDRHRLISSEEFFRGTRSRTSVDPRLVLKEALLKGAEGVLLFHTHPSGDPSPSLEDYQFTRRMAAASDILGVTLVDHMILGSAGSWTSMRQRGACDLPEMWSRKDGFAASE